MKRFLMIALLAACGSEGADVVNPDGGATSDSGMPCGNAISWDPFAPEASSISPIRASVNIVGSPGVFTYTWHVEHENQTVPTTQEASDNSSIGFIAADPGPYHVSVTISGGFTSCPFADTDINVAAPGANTDVYRLRTVPPGTSGAPPQEQFIQVKGGADIVRAITLDPGLDADGTVRNGSGGPGIAAYVKFMPASMPTAFTELFTGAGGTYSTQLIGVTHDVLVIPVSTALAPKLVQWTPTTSSLVVGPGTTVTGTVRNPAGSGLAGAKVQLTSNGVPSTLATTAGNGTFSLHADFSASSMVTVKVTPPAASGLPRLEATAAFTLTQALQIDYSAGLTTCDLVNTPVRRSSVNQPNAKVTVVGSLAGIVGTVTAGAAANALGSVRISASADGTGKLPSILVPRSTALSSVIELGPDDFAVDVLDTSVCAATIIDAPPLVTAAGIATTAATAPLGGIRVEATPLGVLALADAHPILTTTTNGGAFSLPLAAGGHYDVRFIDPYTRVARREDSNITAASVPANVVMPAAIVISGKVSISGSAQPLPGTGVQLLCGQCSGVDATRPIAEGATNSLSDYRIAVPDPGTM